MFCPKCDDIETRVIDSRVVEDGHAIKRRRECEVCGYRFTTFERKSNASLMVIKRDGTKELYDPQKLTRSIALAFAKRNVSITQLQHIVTHVEQKRYQMTGEVSAEQIGYDVLLAIKDIDEVAYVRFASVYGRFATLEDFKKIIG